MILFYWIAQRGSNKDFGDIVYGHHIASLDHIDPQPINQKICFANTRRFQKSDNAVGIPNGRNFRGRDNNRGEAVAGEECLAGRSYMDICRRLTGEDVPVNDYSKSEGFFGKIAQFFHRNQEENR